MFFFSDLKLCLQVPGDHWIILMKFSVYGKFLPINEENLQEIDRKIGKVQIQNIPDSNIINKVPPVMTVNLNLLEI